MQQMRLRTLLKEEPIFLAWFMKPPTITNFHAGPPWRLYVQKTQGGPWARGDLPSYVKAYTQVKLRLPEAWDLAIHSKGQHFKPPTVQKGTKKYWLPMPEGHAWCSLCRRPVVFKTFTKHPALKYGCDPTFPRCSICGMQQGSMRRFPSPLSWPVTLAT